jgi:hypothetical protein
MKKVKTLPTSGHLSLSACLPACLSVSLYFSAFFPLTNPNSNHCFSSQGNFALLFRGPVAESGDSFGCHYWGMGMFLVSSGRAKDAAKKSYNAQLSACDKKCSSATEPRLRNPATAGTRTHLAGVAWEKDFSYTPGQV